MIQIDLPMPEACDVCPLNYDFCWCNGIQDDRWEMYKDDWDLQVCEGKSRPEYCPLKEQPEIVRCRDCVHYHPGFTCELLQKPVLADENWFCPDGKRKDS